MHNGNHDVIVVGAGFAGLACAHEIAKAGRRVCVIDRKRDLGERLHTTGILVEEALANPLFTDLPAGIHHSVSSVKLYAPGLESIELTAPGYRFHTTDTPALMRWLGEQAVTAGVDMRLGCAFREAQATAHGWHLPGVGQCRYLVGADGARSRVAAYFELGRVRDFLHGVEYEYDGAGLRRPDALHCFISGAGRQVTSAGSRRRRAVSRPDWRNACATALHHPTWRPSSLMSRRSWACPSFENPTASAPA